MFARIIVVLAFSSNLEREIRDDEQRLKTREHGVLKYQDKSHEKVGMQQARCNFYDGVFYIGEADERAGNSEENL